LAFAGRRVDPHIRDITTQPNELCDELHNRMLAVLKPEMWPAWLGEELATMPDLKAMLAPSDGMICWPVSPRVVDTKNGNPGEHRLDNVVADKVRSKADVSERKPAAAIASLVA
jgi:hypothetical protein